MQIGSALAIEAAASNAWLIAAPTIWSPQDVSSTNHATKAALICADAIPRLQRLIIPATCCGYGKMPAAQAASQVCSTIVKHPCPPCKVGEPSRFLVHIATASVNALCQSRKKNSRCQSRLQGYIQALHKPWVCMLSHTILPVIYTTISISHRSLKMCETDASLSVSHTFLSFVSTLSLKVTLTSGCLPRTSVINVKSVAIFFLFFLGGRDIHYIHLLQFVHCVHCESTHHIALTNRLFMSRLQKVHALLVLLLFAWPSL